MRLWLCACVVLAAALPRPCASAGDPSFPLETFRHFERAQPPGEVSSDPKLVSYDARRPGFKAIVQFSGARRPLSAEKKRYLEGVETAFAAHGFAQLYGSEIEVVEQGRAQWIPLQESLLPDLLAEVKPGEEFTLSVRYLGHAGSLGRVYAAIGFVDSDAPRVPRSTCFRKELGGVAIGASWSDAVRALSARYGAPFVEQTREGAHYQGFVMDREHLTQLIIADAGASFPGRVFSVQVTGPPNPALALHGALHLGAAPAQLRELLGEPVSEAPSGDGYTRLDYAGSPCSVELRDGHLESLLIADDPYYFQY